MPVRWFGACLVLTGFCSTTVAQAPPLEWKGAAARTVITPTEPMYMAGYASRNKPSEGVALDLYAKVLVLEDAQGQQQGIVTLDLIGVPRPVRERLEVAIRERFQWPPEALWINASHTHCGPELRATAYDGKTPADERTKQAAAYVARLEAAILDMLADCRSRLAPVKLGWSHARCGFAMNRRLPTPTGFQNSPYPDGPVDHDVPILRVDDAEGKLQAVLFGYACHNTTLGFYEFCGDYAGFAQRAVEEAHPGVVALFAIGCGGDQNPYPRGQLDLCQQHGRSLATAVEAGLLPAAKPIRGKLSRGIETVTLEFAPPPDKATLETRTQSKNVYEAAHAKRMLALLEKNGKINTTYPYLIQAIRLGDEVTIITLAGEVVVDYSLRLKRELTGSATWVAGYSNDVFGYVPSRRVLEEGGYEGGGAMLYTSHPGPFAPDVEERIITGVHGLVKRLK